MEISMCIWKERSY